jgi:hypothetical protein
MSTKLEKAKVGRPPIMQENIMRKLEAAISAGFNVSVSCHLSGISRSTYYEYMAYDKEFSDRMKYAEEITTYRARQVILSEIEKGSFKAACYWLERKARVEFAPPKGL